MGGACIVLFLLMRWLRPSQFVLCFGDTVKEGKLFKSFYLLLLLKNTTKVLSTLFLPVAKFFVVGWMVNYIKNKSNNLYICSAMS